MAGVYPDVPSNRIAWDRDAVLLSNGGEVGSGTRAGLNSESFGAYLSVGYGGGLTWRVIFARKLDLSGWFLSGGLYGAYGGFGANYWSPDTTNGSDGTWNGWSAPIQGASSQNSRSSITVSSLSSVRGIGGSFSGATGATYLQAIHLYGRPSVDQNMDRLEIWHPTLDQRVGGAFFDWGDTARGSTEDRVFRVKNRSDVYTAGTITVGIEALSDTSPSHAGSFLLSSGGSFTNSVSIGNLFPGAVSGTITVRRATPVNAVLSTWMARVFATATTWT